MFGYTVVLKTRENGIETADNGFPVYISESRDSAYRAACQHLRMIVETDWDLKQLLNACENIKYDDHDNPDYSNAVYHQEKLDDWKIEAEKKAIEYGYDGNSLSNDYAIIFTGICQYDVDFTEVVVEKVTIEIV